MTRQEANREILKLLSEVVENQPDWRFGQILINMNVLTRCDFVKCMDPFYEESIKTLENMKGK